MKDDTISRTATIDALNVSMIFGRCNEKTVTFEALKKYAEGVRERIDALPSTQPEIIHCKDCKYNPNPPECGNAACVLFYGMTDQMGFCHHGERRERE